MDFILTKKNYKCYIIIMVSLTNLLFCNFSLLPPYLLKKPKFYIYKKSISISNSSSLLLNESI